MAKLKAPARVGSFKEAVNFFRSRLPMTDAQYNRASQAARDKAFTVAGVAHLDMVADVWNALDKAIAKGTTFEDFKKKVGPLLESAWGGERPGQLETIFRTNVQTAYNAGRWEQMRDPDVVAIRPFFRFIALLDPRTTAICRPLNDTVLPQGNPFWKSNWPPLHFRCRSTVMAVTGEQAAGIGITTTRAQVTPLPGFGKSPDQRGWEPDLSHAPQALVKVRDPRK